MRYVNMDEIQNESKNDLLAMSYLPNIYEDLRSYASAMERDDYNKACAEAAQATEKSIKAIAKANGKLSATSEKKHAISKLSEICPELKDINKQTLKKMEKAYFDGRYPKRNGNRVEFERDDAVEMGKTAGEVVDVLIEKLNVGENELNKNIGLVDNPSNVDDFKTYNRLIKR